MAKVFTVYRVDYVTKAKVPIGTVTERREKPRGYDNPLGLVKLARKIYGTSPEDYPKIVLGEEKTA